MTLGSMDTCLFALIGSENSRRQLCQKTIHDQLQQMQEQQLSTRRTQQLVRTARLREVRSQHQQAHRTSRPQCQLLSASTARNANFASIPEQHSSIAFVKP